MSTTIWVILAVGYALAGVGIGGLVLCVIRAMKLDANVPRSWPIEVSITAGVLWPVTALMMLVFISPGWYVVAKRLEALHDRLEGQ